MSNWAHVAGIIRIDGFKDKETVHHFDALLGKEIHWDSSSREEWKFAMEHKDLYLPMGSEGSLYKHIWKNPNKNSYTRYTVSIFGDLRDYWGSEKIIEWFQAICQKFHIRQATITVREDYAGTKNWTYFKDKG